MSLINQMLKDIDQRDSQKTSQGHVSSKYMPSGTYRAPAFYVTLGVVVSVGLMLLLLWVLRLGNEPDQVLPEPEVEAISRSPDTPVQRELAQSNTVPSRPLRNESEEAVQVESEIEEQILEQQAETSNGRERPARESQSSVEVDEVVEVPPEQNEQSEESSDGEMTISRSDASPREIAQRYFDQGLQFLAQGQQQQGASRLQEALLLAPEFHDAREELAIYYFSRGFLSDSLLILERGLERFPNHPRLLLLQARILERSDQQRMALELLRDVPARFPQHADLLSLRASLAEQLEDYELAIGTYETLLAWRSDEGIWWLGLALSYDAKGNTENARQAYRSALTDPRLAEASHRYIQQRLEALP